MKALDSHGVQEILVCCSNEQEPPDHHGRKLRSVEAYDSSWWECIIWDVIHTNGQEVLSTVKYVVMTGVRNCGLDRR